jgi:hypothetical protein
MLWVGWASGSGSAGCLRVTNAELAMALAFALPFAIFLFGFLYGLGKLLLKAAFGDDELTHE